MDNIGSALSELRDNSKRMLNRCKQVCSEPTCQCKVECELFRQEINALEIRCTAIEKSSRENEDKTKTVWESINTMKHEQDNMQRALYVNLETSNPSTVSSNKPHKCTWKPERTASGDGDSFVQQTNDDEVLRGIEVEQAMGAMGKTACVGGVETDQSKDSFNNGARNKTSACINCGVKSGTCDNAQTDTPAVQEELVRQVEQRKLFGTRHWSAIVEHERNECEKLFNELEGYHTVLCLDISASMLENGGWEQASIFVKDFINGLTVLGTTYSFTDEYIALVTFGHETVVKQRLPNNYGELLRVFSELKLGGPSTFYGGLLLSIMLARCSRYLACRSNHEIVVPRRIIIITDGKPTDVNVIAGPDTITSCIEETKQIILSILGSRSVMMNDIVFVPVGNVDTKRAGMMAGLFMRRRVIVTVEDQEDLFSIEERSNRYTGMFETLRRAARNEDCYHERVRSALPTIGSRVRRGPEWIWYQEDSSGLGTIVGHAEDTDDIWVQWDNDETIQFYRYGESGHYDVLIEDEPRELQDGRTLVVGCNVKPGNSWNQSEYKPRRGVVVKIESEKAMVRWDNGQRGEFSADLENGELEYSRILQRHLDDNNDGSTM